MKKKPADLIIEAARLKPNGQLVFVRAYQRRGATFSDCIILTRSEVLEEIQKGKSVATGQREQFMASTFIGVKPVRAVSSGDRFIITSGNPGATQDALPGTPIL